MTAVLSEGTRKRTRKDHVCVVCDRKIHAGSPANWQVNVGGDWGFCMVYWHTNCDITETFED